MIDVAQEYNQLGAIGGVRVAERLRGRVQEFICKAARELFEHLVFRRSAG